MVDRRQRFRPCRPTRLFMAAVAFLSIAGWNGRGRARIDPRLTRPPDGLGDCRLGSMRDVFDIYTIIFLALAVFIFLRLRSVLGQRTGRERPPYDPYSTHDAVRSPANDQVVTLPPRPPETATRNVEPAPPPADRWKGVAETGSSIAAGLDAVVAVDPTFDAGHFITGARTAYEMIVTAFAEGDRRQLRSLLSREVYEGFDTVIGERESRGET